MNLMHLRLMQELSQETLPEPQPCTEATATLDKRFLCEDILPAAACPGLDWSHLVIDPCSQG